ncbi:dihydrofolate reductase family protein [Clostridium sardiniense]|uniref:dihydrofolate reductase family protein n=1 Tax=Clostridium sardiniense TaxID=29369 RepID=UPI00195AB419|nr:dihydrofolate reductase family protein [Clostridium sardiniense]MBM7836751.1 dihydrofolate reductase [Clostridium sardiniense]
MKRKIILYIATSLDGFIADKNGGVSWIDEAIKSDEVDNSYSEFIKNIDTVIMGMTTYNQVVTELSPNEWPYEGLNSYVFTSQNINDTNNVKFISTDILDFVKELKERNGKDIWIVGGANIANQLIKSNLIDEYHISTIPIILGSGMSLFNNDNPKIPLNLDKCSEVNGIVTSIYSRRR